MGVVMYALLFRMFPFDRHFPSDWNKEDEFDSSMCENVSAEARDLVQIMLDRDPNHRPSAQEALDHPFFQLHPNDQFQENDEIFNALTQDIE